MHSDDRVIDYARPTTRPPGGALPWVALGLAAGAYPLARLARRWVGPYEYEWVPATVVIVIGVAAAILATVAVVRDSGPIWLGLLALLTGCALVLWGLVANTDLGRDHPGGRLYKPASVLADDPPAANTARQRS